MEGPVLFWQFFQERPSIRWSIVLERDLSLLNSWLAARSRCYKGIESLRGTLSRRGRVTAKDGGPRVIIYYFTLTWVGGPNVASSLTNQTWSWFSLCLFPTDARFPAKKTPKTTTTTAAKKHQGVISVFGTFVSSKRSLILQRSVSNVGFGFVRLTITVLIVVFLRQMSELAVFEVAKLWQNSEGWSWFRFVGSPNAPADRWSTIAHTFTLVLLSRLLGLICRHCQSVAGAATAVDKQGAGFV